MYQVVKKVVTMKTREGVELVADIYRPQTEESLPILLMRQPYGRAIASTVVYAHPKWYANQGYIVVIQDVRGRGDSGGEFSLFEKEIEDGEDTLHWLSQLEGSTGEVGMYGFSYQGMTQLYCAISQHPVLKTICPAMTAYDLYTDWAYENGAFCYQLNLAWAVQLAAETARLKEDLSAYKILSLASKDLPYEQIPLRVEEVLRKYCPSNFYYQWLNHPENDSYWQKLSPKTYFDNVDLPMLHVGGWFDGYLRGTWNLYQEMSAKSAFQQSLIIGPWAHIPWGNTRGDRTYSPLANNNINEIQIAWFDKYLKGIEKDVTINKNIQLFIMGSNLWNFSEKISNKKTRKIHLNSTGTANLRDDDGQLLLSNTKNITDSEDIIVLDFWRPVPSFGGHPTLQSGSVNRAELDNRSDIITYTSEFLEEELTIIGEIELTLYLLSEQNSFDICAILSQVYTDGKVYNFTQGYIKVKEFEPSQPIKFNLQPTAISLAKNTALRLSLSTTAFPAYSLNTGVHHSDKNLTLNNQTLTLSILSGSTTPSHLTF